MRFDAQLVKDSVSIKDLFERDGHVLRRAGPDDLVCKCPFHDEKTASCHVHPGAGYFKCFGCGMGGDIFKYWQESRRCDFSEAIAQLGSGKAAETAAPTVKRQKEEEPLAPAMQGEHLEAWLKAVERLRDLEDRQRQMALWRGYSIETIRWANERGLLGLIPMFGVWREAFLVQRPEVGSQMSENTGMVPVGYHVRLGPNTAGNQSDKASWRYVPTGIGAWPFVIGDVTRATAHFHLEGQWDALALLDAMGWTVDGLPEKVAIIGMRGATSWKRFVRSEPDGHSFYKWSSEAVGFALLDADSAGKGWLSEDGFLNTVRERYKRVFGFYPSSMSTSTSRSTIKDFNDLWKDRAVTREQLSILFKDKLRRETRGRRPMGPTFLQYCRSLAGRAEKNPDDAVAMAAQFIVKDVMYRPNGRPPLKVWERYMMSHVPEERHAGIRAAWREWVSGETQQTSNAQHPTSNVQ